MVQRFGLRELVGGEKTYGHEASHTDRNYKETPERLKKRMGENSKSRARRTGHTHEKGTK